MQRQRGELVPIGEVVSGLDGCAGAGDPRRHAAVAPHFRVKILRELKKIKLAWPELNYSTAPGVLILLPSVPTIPPVESSPRLAR